MSNQMIYAGFWKRLCAGIVDFFVIVPFIFFDVWLGSFSKEWALVLLVPMGFLYATYDIFFHARWGQTIGKKATGIRVVRLNGEPISWHEASLRSSVDVVFAILRIVSTGFALSNFPDAQYLSLGWMERQSKIVELSPSWLHWVDWVSHIWVWSEVITLLFNKKKRAIHDFIAGTVVIHTKEQRQPTNCQAA